ncbi:YoaK family protein [Enterococcus sp. LJL98]
MIQNKQRQRKIILALFLSGFSGFIDILGLFGIGGMFLSFMSGNSTRLAFYLAEADFIQALPYLFLILSFVFGAFLGDLIKSRFPRENLLAILSTETFLVFCSFLMIHFDFQDEWSYLPLTTAMGLQNAIQIQVDEKIIGRTFFSGVLHSLGTDISQALQKKKPWKAPMLDLLIWTVAVSGAFLAGILQPLVPKKSLFAGVLFILLFLIFIIIIVRSTQKNQAFTKRYRKEDDK